jgi:hypothetical protein
VSAKKKVPSRAIVRREAGSLPEGYAPFLSALKARIHAAHVKAAVTVNSELVLL